MLETLEVFPVCPEGMTSPSVGHHSENKTPSSGVHIRDRTARGSVSSQNCSSILEESTGSGFYHCHAHQDARELVCG